MVALHAPATLDDLLAVLAPAGVCDRFVWDVVRAQVRDGLSYAIRDASGRALVLGGFYPAAEYHEAWFFAAPGAAAHMAGVLAQTRLTFGDLCQSDPRPVVAMVRSAAGAVIARRLGFRPVPAMRGLWRWGGQHGRSTDEGVRGHRPCARSGAEISERA